MGKVADKKRAELHREMIGETEYAKWSEEALKYGKILYTGLRYAGVSSSRKPWEKLPELERIKWGEAALHIHQVTTASNADQTVDKLGTFTDRMMGALEKLTGPKQGAATPDFLKGLGIEVVPAAGEAA